MLRAMDAMTLWMITVAIAVKMGGSLDRRDRRDVPPDESRPMRPLPRALLIYGYSSAAVLLVRFIISRT
ncbi:hypothetical protein OV208_02750 [Corallococcus sp. bb12-1]|uniref:hypothetical protein n=1 Tax=Corallococcus sp. bb12-1 TaxID=2996784 RepID=UPI002270F38F|nr:hypothetical protein [Corallococcus sp. bb12-1]MCY1040226.1 hypothetical protein [Corallococcus sp. bb12-1]